MKTDKTTIGLSIVLAAVVALAVLSASFPASGLTAEQSATVTRNTTAVSPMNQTGESDVTSWSFTGISGATNATPCNSYDEQQTDANGKSVVTLNNNNSVNMKTYLNFGAWNPTDTVSKESYNISTANTSTGSTGTEKPETNDWTEISTFDVDLADEPIIESGKYRNLWLKVDLKEKGTATSTFVVESEVL